MLGISASVRQANGGHSTPGLNATTRTWTTANWSDAVHGHGYLMADHDANFMLTRRQMDILVDTTRFKIIIAGRRSGKSFLAMVALIEQAASKPNQVCWYLGPNLDDTRDVMWKPVLEWMPPAIIAKKNDTRLELLLTNGSEIRMMSADKSKRGRGLDLVVLDEFAMYDRSVWEEELRPALSDKQGRAIFITTPTGHNWAYDLYMKGLDEDPEWKSWQFTTAEGGIVPATEIMAARKDLDPRIFRQEYEASFEVMAGRVYSNFDRLETVRDDLVDTGGDVLVGMDFHVNPMSAVIATRAGDECHILDSLEILTSNTEEMGVELLTRYPKRSIIVCPDPSGKARKTSAPVDRQTSRSSNVWA